MPQIETKAVYVPIPNRNLANYLQVLEQCALQGYWMADRLDTFMPDETPMTMKGGKLVKVEGFANKEPTPAFLVIFQRQKVDITKLADAASQVPEPVPSPLGLVQSS